MLEALSMEKFLGPVDGKGKWSDFVGKVIEEQDVYRELKIL